MVAPNPRILKETNSSPVECALKSICWVCCRRVRFPQNADGAAAFNPSDIFIMNDGGRAGGQFLFDYFPWVPLTQSGFSRASQSADDLEVGGGCHPEK